MRTAIATIVALAVSAALSACGTGTGSGPGISATATPGATTPAPELAPASATPGSMVMVIRHAEKPDGTLPGVDAAGNEDDSSLTTVGWERAHRLVDLFDPAQGAPPSGVGTPAVIYAAGVTDDGEGQRARETVAPLAERLGVPVNTDYGRGQEKKLVEQVVDEPGPVLISWQHGGITEIADAFPSVKPKPPSDWPDDRFDVIWTFTRTADGWRFAQVPERLLPGDSTDIIKK
jgi:broad specificity phosphatase PhoE/predicted small secreted protein